MDGARGQDALDCLWAMWAAARPLHVVDVGANPVEGDAPYKELLARGYARVTGFEPQAAALAKLDAVKTERETYLPDALGAGGRVTLHLYRGSGFTSVFPMRESAVSLLGLRKATGLVGREEIATRRMDDIGELAPADFLKIDVQGSELAIIANGSEKLAQAVAVQTEVRFLPLYDGEPSFGELDAELRRQGFMFHDFSFLKRMATRSPNQAALRRRVYRQVVDGDAFYVRDLTRPDLIDDDQLFRLALLAEGVMQSRGLAVFCLDTLAARGAIGRDAAEDYLRALPAESRRG